MPTEAMDDSEVLAETSFDVNLYIYDLTKGMAKTLSSFLIGKKLEGVWHTSIVAYGREYFFGNSGIESCQPGGTALGEPDQIMPLGKTELPYQMFLEYVFVLAESTFKPGSYDLFEHNCNHFSQELSNFLTSKSIPGEILHLPQDVLDTPFGQALKVCLDTTVLRAEGSRGLHFDFPFENTEKKKKRRESQSKGSEGQSEKRNSSATPQAEVHKMSAAESEVTNGGAPPRSEADEDEDAPTPAPTYTRRTRRYEDPPVLFPDVDGVASLQKVGELMEGKLNEEEKQALKELHDYLTTDSGAWALGAFHLDLIGRLLNDRNFPAEVHLSMLKVLESCAMKDDLILLLHQDRKDHHVMSYIHRIERLSLEEQEEVGKFLCNLCQHPSSFDWLMYISEWQEEGQPCNNSKATVRAAVHLTLGEKPSIQEKGAALMFNLALKELFDDVASELATAVLQYLHSDLKEEIAFYCLTALLRFINISYNDVPALTKMLGPDLKKFRGQSERIDQLVEQLQMKLAVSVGS